MSFIPKRGRPSIDRLSTGKSPVVAVRLSPVDHARAKARSDRESIQDQIRRGLRKVLSEPPPRDL